MIRVLSKRWLLALVAALALPGLVSFNSVTAQAQPVTLIVWDPFIGPAGAAAQKIYDRFTTAHPEIAIERHVLSGGDLDPNALRTALGSGLGPDVLAFDANPESIRLLTIDPVLDPLNEVPVTYDWLGRLPDTAERWLRHDGRLYGLPVKMTLFGLYSNQTLMAKEGLTVPTTVDQLLDFCTRARAKGYVPLAFGNDAASVASLPFTMALNNLIGPPLTAALLFDHQGRWDTFRVSRAIETTFVDLPHAGCFDPRAPAMTDEQATTLFTSGRALLLATGTRLASQSTGGPPGFTAGFIPFPAMDGGRGRFFPSHVDVAYGIGLRSAHPREAAMLLDHIISDDAIRVWAEDAAFLPAIPVDHTGWRVSPLLHLALDAASPPGSTTSAGLSGGTLGYLIDPATPSQFDATMRTGFQAIVAGKKTPEQQAEDLQAIWEKTTKS